MHTVHFLLFLCFFFVFPTFLVGKGKNLCPKNTFGGVLFFIFYFRHFVAEPGHSLTTSEKCVFLLLGEKQDKNPCDFFFIFDILGPKKNCPPCLLPRVPLSPNVAPAALSSNFGTDIQTASLQRPSGAVVAPSWPAIQACANDTSQGVPCFFSGGGGQYPPSHGLGDRDLGSKRISAALKAVWCQAGRGSGPLT